MRFAFFAACLSVCAYAVPRVAMEAATSPANRGLPEGWTSRGRAHTAHNLELVFAVKQQNTDELQARLLHMSTPGSDGYGQHMTNEEVHALVAPAAAHIDTVKAFLTAHNLEVKALTSNQDFLQVTVTVEQAEALLEAEYHTLMHTESGAVVRRCLSYALPEDVAAALDFVAPTVHVPPPPSQRTTTAASDNAIVQSPQVLRDLYSVTPVYGQSPDNKMAVTAFLEQHYSKADLQEFWSLFCGNLTCGKGDVGLVGDETTGVGAGVESMLDIETITGIAGNVTAEFWGFAGRSPDNADNEPFLKWLTQVAATSDADVPNLFSTSYGEDEESWSLSAATRMNTEFQKCGARGITLLYASGDEGANCKQGLFVPETPGSSPWVTAVGGTYLAGTSAIGLSSGGFSGRWEQPDYQQAAVKAYLASGAKLPPTSAGYNISGRAYPDISAQASGFTVVANRVPLPGVAGTSCASPSAAGVIALLNDARLMAGKTTLGFLNPFIYANMDKWNDIVKGSNNGGSCGGGWPAVKGWDASTGVGSPNYKNLVDAALALP